MDYYFHDRDEHGDIIFPRVEPSIMDINEEPEGGWTFEDRFLGVQGLMWSGVMSRRDYIKLIADLHSEFDRPLPSWWENYLRTGEEEETVKQTPTVTPESTQSTPRKSKVIRRGKNG